MGKTAYLYLEKKTLAVFLDGTPPEAYSIDWDGIFLASPLEKVKSELAVSKVEVIKSPHLKTPKVKLTNMLKRATKKVGLELGRIVAAASDLQPGGEPGWLEHEVEEYESLKKGEPEPVAETKVEEATENTDNIEPPTAVVVQPTGGATMGIVADETAAKSAALGEEQIENVQPKAEEPPAPKASRLAWLLIAAVVILLVIFVIGLVRVYLPSTQPAPVEPTPTPIPTATPTPTPTLPDLSQFEVRVLNGSGVSGAAAKLATLLEEKGFTIESRGNAAQSDLTETEIRVKADVPESVIQLLRESLVEYEVVDGSVIEEGARYSVLITLGAPK